jgi:hypothetical protein
MALHALVSQARRPVRCFLALTATGEPSAIKISSEITENSVAPRDEGSGRAPNVSETVQPWGAGAGRRITVNRMTEDSKWPSNFCV